MSAADRRAVAAEELGERVEDDVGAVLERPHQVRRRHRCCRPSAAGRPRGRPRRPPRCRACRAWGWRPSPRRRSACSADGRAERLRIGAVDEGDFDAETAQGVAEERVGAAVDGGRGDEVVAGAGQVEDGSRRWRPDPRRRRPPRLRPRAPPRAPRAPPSSGWRSGCRCGLRPRGRTASRLVPRPRRRTKSTGRSAPPAISSPRRARVRRARRASRSPARRSPRPRRPSSPRSPSCPRRS